MNFQATDKTYTCPRAILAVNFITEFNDIVRVMTDKMSCSINFYFYSFQVIVVNN